MIRRRKKTHEQRILETIRPIPRERSDEEMRYTAREAFWSLYGKHGHLMTPDVIEYRTEGDLHVEISRGTGLDDRDLFGVTVIVETDGKLEHDHELSECFKSQNAAFTYVKTIAENRRLELERARK